MVRLRFDNPEISDPIKVFVKQEPHKISKIREGRFRLISAVSVIDTMVDRIIYGDLIETLPDRVSPCKVGWSPLRGGHRQLRAEMGDQCMSADKTAFDWTVQPWLVDAWSDFLARMLLNPSHEWTLHHKWRFYHLFVKPLYQFSDGVTLEQKEPGIMKSGCLLTIALNSFSQYLAHSIVCLRRGDEPLPIWAMGDDTVQSLQDDSYWDGISSLGFIIKEHIYSDTSFAGFRLVRNGMVPEYRDKHVFLILHTPEEDILQELFAYQQLYVYDPVMLDWIQNLIKERDVTYLRSQFALKQVFSESR